MSAGSNNVKKCMLFSLIAIDLTVRCASALVTIKAHWLHSDGRQGKGVLLL